MAPNLLDPHGRPVDRPSLTREIATATSWGVRSPAAGYPADGLNPVRLASILREADTGHPIRQFELAEAIEERDPHYVGVLGTRRRAVSQIEVTVEPGSDAPDDLARADMVRKWLDRDELADELFDILDCIGKGISYTEIIWDRSEGQWLPARLEYRDPRWFGVDRVDLRTPTMRSETGAELPLPGFKFIIAQIKAKSGLPLRGGLVRVASWAWMFKAYTLRDWAIFTQTYAQPLRLGKFGAGASEQDKETLFHAVANIAGDMAAIIPDTMALEFVQAGNIGSAATNYRDRADWFDRQVSKAVLGQTATTDAIAGGHAVGREHRQVQEDIERADARALAAVLNRDLIRPWMQLEFGPLRVYPRLKIARPEREDLATLTSALGPMIDRGLRVSQAAVRAKFGLPEPAAGEAEMRPMTARPAAIPPEAEAPATIRPIKRVSGEIKGGEALARPMTALNARGPSAASPEPVSETDLQTARLAEDAAPLVGALVGQVEAMVRAAGSLEELREMLLAGFPDLDAAALAELLAQGFLAAHLAGRVSVADDE